MKKLAEITFSFNHPPLNANQRHHWKTRAPIIKRIREETYWKTKALRLPPQNHITIRFHYQPHIKRRRDEDNLVPTLKPIADGIVDAGLVPDDTPDYMHKYMPIIHKVQPEHPARCWLEIMTEEKEQ